MTRQAGVPASRPPPIPFVEINPSDAELLGLRERDLARISNVHGSATLEVRIDDGCRRGQVFAPIHWSAATASHARVGALVRGIPDPISGQPELNATPASIELRRARTRGQLLSPSPTAFPDDWWWCRWPTDGGLLHAFATDLDLDDVLGFFLGNQSGASFCTFHDSEAGFLRIAAFSDDRLIAALDARSDGRVPDEGCLSGRRPGDAFAAADRRELISLERAFLLYRTRDLRLQRRRPLGHPRSVAAGSRTCRVDRRRMFRRYGLRLVHPRNPEAARRSACGILHDIKECDMTSFRDALKSGHTPTLFAAFLYFDFSFAVWVLNGAMGPFYHRYLQAISV